MRLTTEQLEDYANEEYAMPKLKPVASMARELLALRKAMKVAEEGLAQIRKGEGRYSMDQLTHASNTIDDMKYCAEKAQAQIAELLKGWRE